MRLRLFAIAILPIAGGANTMAAPVCTLDRANGTNIDSAPLLRNAYCLRWNAASNRIAYMPHARHAGSPSENPHVRPRPWPVPRHRPRHRCWARGRTWALTLRPFSEIQRWCGS